MDFSNAEVYGRVKAALAQDPALEAKLLDDLGGTLAERFGVAVPQPARLSRDGDAYRLTLGGQNYDLGDPRKAAPDELNEAELELVSGGDAGCGGGGGSSAPSTGAVAQPMDIIKQSNGPVTTPANPSFNTVVNKICIVNHG